MFFDIALNSFFVDLLPLSPCCLVFEGYIHFVWISASFSNVLSFWHFVFRIISIYLEGEITETKNLVYMAFIIITYAYTMTVLYVARTLFVIIKIICK